MATITIIQGTDSLSASRQTLNDNFSAIQTDLVNIDALLDVNSNALAVTTATIGTAVIGGNTLAVAGNVLTGNTQIDGLATLNGGVVYDSETIGVSGSLPSANAWASTTYVVQNPTVSMSAANSGQQVTLIADTATVTVSGTIAGTTTAPVIALNGTLTLRYVGSSWYIISSFNTTIA
jgi:hypothetical protein